ncbi:MAG: hypothetical protein Kow002_07180 [Anaerolineales bacterium]
MKYQLNLKGFEGQNIEMQSPGLFSGAKLLVDGEPAPKGAKRGEMLLRRNDGKDVIAKFKGTFLDVPNLEVDGNVIQVVEPLKWYQWVWNSLPLLIIVGGGALPFLIAFLAIAINLSLFRKSETRLARYGLTGLVTAGAFVLFAVVGVGFALLMN